MKKTAILALLLAASLVSCGKTDDETSNSNDTTAATTTAVTTTDVTTTADEAANTSEAVNETETVQSNETAVVTEPITTKEPDGNVSAGGIMDMYPAIYQSIVEQKFNEVANQHDGLADVDYCFRDLDANGIPELILKYGTCEADFCIDVFYLDNNGDIKTIDCIGGGHTSFAYDENTGDFVIVWAHMGAASINYFKWENGTLKSNGSYDFEINEENPSYEKVLNEKGIKYIDHASAFQTSYESGVTLYISRANGTTETGEGIFTYDLL